MDQILVVLPLDEQKKNELESKAPGAAFVYSDQKTVTKEEVKIATVILGNVPLSHLEDVPNLRWLQLDSAGSDQYAALPVFQSGQAVLSNASGSYGVLIAEYMVGASVLLNVGFHKYRDQQTGHVWKNGAPAKTIDGSRTLVVGLGDIGTHFAQNMHALGSTVTGIRRTKGDVPPYVESVHTLAELHELLPEADIIGICLPQSEETKGVFDDEAFSHVKPGAFLINVGRGSAVKGDALLTALRSGTLGGAVVDVFEEEPLPADHPLWAEPGLMLTPHIGGLSEQSAARAKILALFIRNLENWTKGDALESEVDLETGYRKIAAG
jgi:phosphoglycerate dehydrogenase-like enzyme